MIKFRMFDQKEYDSPINRKATRFFLLSIYSILNIRIVKKMIGGSSVNDEMIKNIADTIKPNNMLADPIVTRKYIKDNMDYFLFLLLPLLIFLVVLCVS